ncbi:unnamed protein product [Sympodiomycopsis kandeliae]
MPVVGPANKSRQKQQYGHSSEDDSDESIDLPSGSRNTARRRSSKRQSNGYTIHGTSTTGSSTTNNATGRSLNVRDARGYDWRAKPTGAPGMHTSRKDEYESDDQDWKIGSGPHKMKADEKARETDSEESDDDDDEAGKGYTQLRLDEDVEGDELHAATEYLFGGPGAGPSSNDPSRSGPVESSVGYSYQNESTATPLSQMMTTKALLSEPQKIAYVGLCALTAKEMVRALKRVPGANKDLADSVKSIEEWEVKVMARLFQHMDIDAKEQNMIKSLGEHGVLATDLAPSLVTTQQIENPDYDPLAAEEKELKDKEEQIKSEKDSDERKSTPLEQERADITEKSVDSDEATLAASEEQKKISEGDPSEQSSISDTESLRTISTTATKVDSADESGDDSRKDVDIEDDDDAEGDLGARPETPTAGSSSHAVNEPESASMEEDDTEGDLGARPETPTPGSSLHTVDEATQSAGATPVQEKQLEDDEGDIGEALDTPPISTETQTQSEGAPDSPSETPEQKQESLAPSSQDPSVSSTQPPRADPNTAAQAAAAEANVTAEKPSGAFGLTSEPQVVEPPPSALPGVTTALSTTDEHITLDLRWTILCDLFLVLTADSVYDARSRVLLERIAEQLGLTWMDVTKFEKRVTDALEIEEGVEKLKDKSAIARRAKEARNKKWAMVGLATVGGGLVIGLSAGLAAPLVGAGLAGFLGTVGIGGTSSFLAGVGGAALITTTGTIGGATLGGRGMNRRTQSVRTFQFKPIHNSKRVNCIVALPGFMNGDQDDVRLPFSVIDSIMGDVFSVLWEPEMMREMGNAIYILWNETIVMGVQQVLAATIAGGLLGALAWPLWLTKLGYLIDNPWSNALTRAEAAGKILADVLARRQLGVRPITLVGFSLGARAIFYALIELAKKKAFGVVQNVYIFGAPITASDRTWREARSAVGGRFVNGFSRTDWILGYLFRATSGGLRSIAGLRPVERVPEIENVDVTTSVPGHLQYRAFMPLVLSEVGFRVTQDWFDEPEDLSKIPDREIIRQEMAQHEEEIRAQKDMKTVKTSTGGFGKIFRRNRAGMDSSSDSKSGSTSASGQNSASTSRPTTPSVGNAPGPSLEANLKAALEKSTRKGVADDDDEDDLPPREDHPVEQPQQAEEPSVAPSTPAVTTTEKPGAGVADNATTSSRPSPAMPRSSSSETDDMAAILAELRESGIEVKELQSSLPALALSSENSSPRMSSGSLAAPKSKSLQERKPSSLKTSVSALFSSPSSRKTSDSTPAVDSPSSINSPALSVPSGTYSGVDASRANHRERGLPSPTASSAKGLESDYPSSSSPWGQEGESTSSSSDSRYRSNSRGPTPYARPFHLGGEHSSSSVFQLPDLSTPQNNETPNLSFASDFDDDTVEESFNADDRLKQYGLSNQAAKELSRQFNSSEEDSKNEAYLNPFASSSSAPSQPATPAVEESGWSTSTTPNEIASYLTPMENTYTPGRERTTSTSVNVDEEVNPWG